MSIWTCSFLKVDPSCWLLYFGFKVVVAYGNDKAYSIQCHSVSGENYENLKTSVCLHGDASGERSLSVHQDSSPLAKIVCTSAYVTRQHRWPSLPSSCPPPLSAETSPSCHRNVVTLLRDAGSGLPVGAHCTPHTAEFFKAISVEAKTGPATIHRQDEQHTGWKHPS